MKAVFIKSIEVSSLLTLIFLGSTAFAHKVNLCDGVIPIPSYKGIVYETDSSINEHHHDGLCLAYTVKSSGSVCVQTEDECVLLCATEQYVSDQNPKAGNNYGYTDVKLTLRYNFSMNTVERPNLHNGRCNL